MLTLCVVMDKLGKMGEGEPAALPRKRAWIQFVFAVVFLTSSSVRLQNAYQETVY
jgi:hypothetical protein